jgi:hypothetical protein
MKNQLTFEHHLESLKTNQIMVIKFTEPINTFRNV